MQEGVVSSGNSLDYSKEDWDQLNAIGAAVKEMEAAGISWVAHLHNVPFLALKSITDIVDGDRPAQEEFLENLHAAAKALQVCSLTLCCVNATPVEQGAEGGLGNPACCTQGLQVYEHSCSFLFNAVAASIVCWGVLAARAPDPNPKPHHFRGTWSCCKLSHLLHLKGDQGCGCLNCEILQLGAIQAGDTWVGAIQFTSENMRCGSCCAGCHQPSDRIHGRQVHQGLVTRTAQPAYHSRCCDHLAWVTGPGRLPVGAHAASRKLLSLVLLLVLLGLLTRA